MGMLGMLVLSGCSGNNNDNGGSAPGAPQNPQATAGDGSVTIQWSAVDGASSYNIYWSTTAGVTKATGTKIEGATSPYAHTGLTNGTTYYYVVTAVNGAGESAESAEVSARPQVAAPGVPQNPSATAGALSVTVKWDAVTGATSYNIYWSNTAGVTKANGTKITNATSPYQHNSLTPGITYYYVVTAVNATGESAESAQVSAAVLSNAKGITAFSFANPAATGTTDETAKTIAVTVPYGTNVTALVATFITTGASVKVDGTEQVSGTTPNNFTGPVVYTVTAADSTSVTYTVTVTVAGAIALPKTGQVISHDTNTIQRDDGALQMGVAWPSPRFIDNADGTVTDNLTALMWLQDANCIKTNYAGFDADGTAGDGAVTWQHALDFVAGINAGTYANCGGGLTGWRLPNRKELRSLTNYGQTNISAWLNTQGFNNVQTNVYWSSSTYAANTAHAWYVSMINTIVNANNKALDFYMWPVRSVSFAAPAELPKTGQTTCYDASGTAIACTGTTGQDGDLQKGVAWPNPRFTIASSGTGTVVRDSLTGLMWSSDAGAPTVGTCTGGTMTWQQSLDYAACLNINNYLGHNDWRLPNVNELESLVHAGYNQETTCGGVCATNAAWLNTQGAGNPGFSNVQASSYWSATDSSISSAWVVSMNEGSLGATSKSAIYYVLPVRGGQ